MNAFQIIKTARLTEKGTRQGAKHNRTKNGECANHAKQLTAPQDIACTSGPLST